MSKKQGSLNYVNQQLRKVSNEIRKSNPEAADEIDYLVAQLEKINDLRNQNERNELIKLAIDILEVIISSYF